ncbi:23635_t:CDS:2, partial [Gigaspora margarita]
MPYKEDLTGLDKYEVTYEECMMLVDFYMEGQHPESEKDEKVIKIKNIEDMLRKPYSDSSKFKSLYEDRNVYLANSRNIINNRMKIIDDRIKAINEKFEMILNNLQMYQIFDLLEKHESECNICLEVGTTFKCLTCAFRSHSYCLMNCLKIDKTFQFSKQSSEVYELLKSIKDTNKYGDDFFLAAQKFINELYNKSKLEKQPNKQIFTDDNWSSSTETLIGNNLNSNQTSSFQSYPELSVSRCSEDLGTYRTTDSLECSLASEQYNMPIQQETSSVSAVCSVDRPSANQNINNLVLPNNQVVQDSQNGLVLPQNSHCQTSEENWQPNPNMEELGHGDIVWPQQSQSFFLLVNGTNNSIQRNKKYIYWALAFFVLIILACTYIVKSNERLFGLVETGLFEQ